MGDQTINIENLVYDVIDEIGPVTYHRVAEVTFDGNKMCGECDRVTEEFKQHKREVKEVVLHLNWQNQIYPNVDWEYDVQTGGQ